jgi:hypothetical protein
LKDARLAKLHVLDMRLSHVVRMTLNARICAVLLCAKQHARISQPIVIVVTLPAINLVKRNHATGVWWRAFLIWYLETRLLVEDILAWVVTQHRYTQGGGVEVPAVPGPQGLVPLEDDGECFGLERSWCGNGIAAWVCADAFVVLFLRPVPDHAEIFAGVGLAAPDPAGLVTQQIILDGLNPFVTLEALPLVAYWRRGKVACDKTSHLRRSCWTR